MWGMAHLQGIRLPTKNYWKFVELITASPNKVKSFEDYLAMFHWTELIQSNPPSVERSVYETIAGAYRKNNITLLELRFNPMKRNRGGEQDLDHIMMAAIRGLDRALLEYPVKAGIIVCLDRTFDLRTNQILLEKALRYQSRGVVGIDIAGSRNPKFHYADCKAIYRRARKEGLGLTVHAGEDEGPESVRDAIEHLEPDRIGHGVRATEDDTTMDLLKERHITLEVCPSSNLQTHVVQGVGQMKHIFRRIKEYRVRYTINTDGPEMLATYLRKEIDFLLRNGILTSADILKATKWAFASSFLEGR
jgi:adenosine deaminase